MLSSSAFPSQKTKDDAAPYSNRFQNLASSDPNVYLENTSVSRLVGMRSSSASDREPQTCLVGLYHIFKRNRRGRGGQSFRKHRASGGFLNARSSRHFPGVRKIQATLKTTEGDRFLMAAYRLHPAFFLVCQISNGNGYSIIAVSVNFHDA